jgi:hypothetical protein
MRARTIAVGATVAALLVASCGDPTERQRVSAVSTTSSLPSTASDASPSARQPRAVVLPRLPEQGVVVEDGGSVVLVDLDGRVITRLRGFELYYQRTVPGPVVLRRDRDEYFVLHVGSHTVGPLTSRDDASALSPQFQAGFGPDADPELPYPVGTRIEDQPELRSGFWAYALPSPDGSRVLAQWSGECEVPNAFFVEEGSAVTVDGYRSIVRAADSIALGWTPDGRAVVMLFGGACSNGIDRPGVYVFEAPGAGELMFETDGSARMWGAG